MDEFPFWNLSLDRLLAKLKAAPTGLTSREAQRRYLKYGPNDSPDYWQPPAGLQILRRFRNPLVLILLFAGALSAATGDASSFALVIGAVLLSVSIGFLQGRRAEATEAALRQRVALRARVIRDGTETPLPVRQLVPGDVVKLIAGDLAPADGRLLAAQCLYVNQALLTSESYLAEKRATSNLQPQVEADLATDKIFAAGALQSAPYRTFRIVDGPDQHAAASELLRSPNARAPRRHAAVPDRVVHRLAAHPDPGDLRCTGAPSPFWRSSACPCGHRGRRCFASHRCAALPACGTAVRILIIAVTVFLVLTELAKRAFYARLVPETAVPGIAAARLGKLPRLETAPVTSPSPA